MPFWHYSGVPKGQFVLDGVWPVSFTIICFLPVGFLSGEPFFREKLFGVTYFSQKLREVVFSRQWDGGGRRSRPWWIKS